MGNTNIYFIGSVVTEIIKIGISHNPNQRFKQIQEANATELELFKVLCDVPKEYERKIHALFQDLRLRGEWFRLTNNLFKFISNVNENNLDKLLLDPNVTFVFDTSNFIAPKVGETKDIILELLSQKQMTFDEIYNSIGKSKATISQHLQELNGLGKISTKTNPEDKRSKIFFII